MLHHTRTLILLFYGILSGMETTGQTNLLKTVSGSGGQQITGNTYKINLTVGQSMAGTTRGNGSGASVGFWYLPRNPVTRSKIVKNPVAIERRIPSGTHGSLYELQRHTHAEKINFLKIYPNPVVSRASLEFQLAEDGNVHLALFDFRGNRVSTLIRRKMEAGRYKMELNANQLPGAVYSLVLMTGRFRIQEKFMVMN